MNFKSKTMGMIIAFAGIAILPLTKAQADEWNKETNVTLSAPMEIPGQDAGPTSPAPFRAKALPPKRDFGIDPLLLHLANSSFHWPLATPAVNGF
jgi:hypothetical protein